MKLKILFLLLPALLLASCSGEDDGFDPGTQADGQIRFEIGFAGQGVPQSRAATDADFKTVWETGDEIGIFAVKQGEPLAASGNSIHNMKVTYNGTSWNGAYWPNDENKNENLDFYAYYPYDGSVTDPTGYTFSVMADQSGATDGKPNYNLSDLMTAKAPGQSKGAAVSLQFSHALSLVQVEVEREMNVPRFDETDFTVTLTGALPSVNLGWDALTGTGTAADIVMRKVEGIDYTYRALVPAQTLAADAKVTFVQNTTGREINMEYQGVKSAALTAKATHKYRVTLGWGIDPDHKYAVGDVYPHVGPAVGIVFYTENNGKNGKVVGFQEKSSVAWGPWGDTYAKDMANGLANMATIYALANDFSGFPAFAWVHGLNDASEDYSDANATGVWYLPSIGELQYLYCAWNGKDPETWKFPGSDDSGSSYPTWHPSGEGTARTNFNDKLTAAGGAGAVLGNYYYWSSSESDYYNAWIVGFDFGYTHSDLKDYGSSDDRARCVLAF